MQVANSLRKVVTGKYELEVNTDLKEDVWQDAFKMSIIELNPHLFRFIVTEKLAKLNDEIIRLIMNYRTTFGFLYQIRDILSKININRLYPNKAVGTYDSNLQYDIHTKSIGFMNGVRNKLLGSGKRKKIRYDRFNPLVYFCKEYEDDASKFILLFQCGLFRSNLYEVYELLNEVQFERCAIRLCKLIGVYFIPDNTSKLREQLYLCEYITFKLHLKGIIRNETIMKFIRVYYPESKLALLDPKIFDMSDKCINSYLNDISNDSIHDTSTVDDISDISDNTDTASGSGTISDSTNTSYKGINLREIDKKIKEASEASLNVPKLKTAESKILLKERKNMKNTLKLHLGSEVEIGRLHNDKVEMLIQQNKILDRKFVSSILISQHTINKRILSMRKRNRNRKARR